MKLKDLRDASDTFSGKLSELVRQLSFAGIAVIWIFRIGHESGGIAYSNELLYPLGCFVLSLCFDFFHYLYGYSAWALFHTYKQGSGVDNNTEFKAPGCINVLTNIFFFLKTFFVFLGYIFLLMAIGRQLIGN